MKKLIPFDKGVNRNRTSSIKKQQTEKESEMIDISVMSKSIYYDPIVGAKFTPTYLK